MKTTTLSFINNLEYSQTVKDIRTCKTNNQSEKIRAYGNSEFPKSKCNLKTKTKNEGSLNPSDQNKQNLFFFNQERSNMNKGDESFPKETLFQNQLGFDGNDLKNSQLEIYLDQTESTHSLEFNDLKSKTANGNQLKDIINNKSWKNNYFESDSLLNFGSLSDSEINGEKKNCIEDSSEIVPENDMPKTTDKSNPEKKNSIDYTSWVEIPEKQKPDVQELNFNNSSKPIYKSDRTRKPNERIFKMDSYQPEINNSNYFDQDMLNKMVNNRKTFQTANDNSLLTRNILINERCDDRDLLNKRSYQNFNSEQSISEMSELKKANDEELSQDQSEQIDSDFSKNREMSGSTDHPQTEDASYETKRCPLNQSGQTKDSLIKESSQMMEMDLNLELLLPRSENLKSLLESVMEEMKGKFEEAGVDIKDFCFQTESQKEMVSKPRIMSLPVTQINKQSMPLTRSVIITKEYTSEIDEVKLFDKDFLNRHLHNKEAFSNIINNTFLKVLKTEGDQNLFKRYSNNMDKLKPWMFSQLEYSKKMSNFEQFLKYISLQVPIKQCYFAKLNIMDRVKSVCYFFCKFVHREKMMELSGDFWSEVNIGTSKKNKSKKLNHLKRPSSFSERDESVKKMLNSKRKEFSLFNQKYSSNDVIPFIKKIMIYSLHTQHIFRQFLKIKTLGKYIPKIKEFANKNVVAFNHMLLEKKLNGHMKLNDLFIIDNLLFKKDIVELVKLFDLELFQEYLNLTQTNLYSKKKSPKNNEIKRKIYLTSGNSTFEFWSSDYEINIILCAKKKRRDEMIKHCFKGIRKGLLAEFKENNYMSVKLMKKKFLNDMFIKNSKLKENFLQINITNEIVQSLNKSTKFKNAVNKYQEGELIINQIKRNVLNKKEELAASKINFEEFVKVMVDKQKKHGWILQNIVNSIEIYQSCLS